MIYYNERIQSKLAKGKGIWSAVWRKPGANFQESSPSGVTGEALSSCSRVVTTGVKCCLLRKLIRDSVLRYLLGADQVPKFQTLERKQVFNKTHCTNSLGITSHSYYSGTGGNPPKI